MFIHKTSCISPQRTFENIDFTNLMEPVENKFKAIEPIYSNIPSFALRRMGRAIRMGIGSALPLVMFCPNIKGVIIGTSSGGTEDCIKFLNEIIKYKEGTLSPSHFVNSTSNAIAAQIGLISKNTNYNTTHVHRGHAFENALIDTWMLTQEQPNDTFLLGGVDEISTYNFNIEFLSGSYRSEITSLDQLYSNEIEGTLAGECATMFLVSGKKEKSIAQIKNCLVFTTEDENQVTKNLSDFLKNNNIHDDQLDLFISGENGDARTRHFYLACEKKLVNSTILNFKHITGESPTISAFAVWLATHLIQTQEIPITFIKSLFKKSGFSKILLYNNYKGLQHSFILINSVE